MKSIGKRRLGLVFVCYDSVKEIKKLKIVVFKYKNCHNNVFFGVILHRSFLSWLWEGLPYAYPFVVGRWPPSPKVLVKWRWWLKWVLFLLWRYEHWNCIGFVRKRMLASSEALGKSIWDTLKSPWINILKLTCVSNFSLYPTTYRHVSKKFIHGILSFHV